MSLCVLFRPEKTCPFYLYSVVVKKLLDLGADQSLEVLKGPYSGKTACLMAKVRNSTDIVQFFKSEGLG